MVVRTVRGQGIVLAVTALLVGLVGLVVFADPQRTAAAQTPPADLASTVDKTVIALQGEVLLLVELGAFPEPVPVLLRDIHQASKQFLAGLDRPALRSWLRDADREAANQLPRLVQAQVPLREQTRTALRTLPDPAYQALSEGRPIGLPAAASYVSALEELANLSDRATGSQSLSSVIEPKRSNPSAGTTLAPRTPASPPTAATVTTVTTADGVQHSAGIVQVKAMVALAAAGAAIGAFLVLLVVRSRRRASTDVQLPLADVEAVLEAGRRLASVDDPAALHATIVGQTRSLLDAEGVLYLRQQQGKLVVVHADGAGVDVDPQAIGELKRVADTGQPWRGSLQCAGHSLAALAAAVTAGGQVQGVLVALRSAERPFDAVANARMYRLAPLVAAALAAASRHDALAALALTDPLTKLANRRQLDRDVRATIDRSGPNNGLIGFAMVDVDHFKIYNDTHGHPAGDELLRTMAELLAANVRPGDVVYRYGGEEFSIMLPGADRVEAAEVAERVRRAVHDADLGGEAQPAGRVTVSVGVAVGPAAEIESLTGSADRSLYEAKQHGRDRVVVAAST